MKAMMKEAALRLADLERKLLALGGEAVNLPRVEPHAARLLAGGRVFDMPVKMKRGKPHCCHGNAAALWAENLGRVRLATGYALSHGRWFQHSWAVRDGLLYETTVGRDMYFGVLLADGEALKFWFDNYLPQRCPGLGELIQAISRKAAQAAA